MQPKDIASYIDHTLLKADATTKDIELVCQEALTHHFASVCVNSSHVALVSKILKNSNVKTVSVVGFPLGAMKTEAKAFETKTAIHDGADEIDMVINIGALKERNLELVTNDIRAVVEAAANHPVKVILETDYLNDEEKKLGCEASKKAGAKFVKTSTGFATNGKGATEHDVKLMRSCVGSELGVKASGGVRSSEDALKMIAAGANRLGTSSSVKIISGVRSDSNY